jgi:hypothetical protein
MTRASRQAKRAHARREDAGGEAATPDEKQKKWTVVYIGGPFPGGVQAWETLSKQIHVNIDDGPKRGNQAVYQVQHACDSCRVALYAFKGLRPKVVIAKELPS